MQSLALQPLLTHEPILLQAKYLSYDEVTGFFHVRSEPMPPISDDYKILSKAKKIKKIHNFMRLSPEIAAQFQFSLATCKYAPLNLIGKGTLTCLRDPNTDEEFLTRFMSLLCIGLREKSIEAAVESMTAFMISHWEFSAQKARDALYTLSFECNFVTSKVYQYIEIAYFDDIVCL